MYWGDMIVGSKIFRLIIKGAFWTSIVIALLLTFMVINFIFKITLLDYRFDDGELHPPIEIQINNDHLNSTIGCVDPRRLTTLFVEFLIEQTGQFSSTRGKCKNNNVYDEVYKWGRKISELLVN
ncbi:hypothetical protein [Fredinandcohnia onubensis]|uniref:hypothetical protein n=1 Tax=Fredinandcohnia onubensis TaxID=1571209 RepID=UPI000C0C06AD|nr:hypothetical protein [Fredinandcohnia onubensis]